MARKPKSMVTSKAVHTGKINLNAESCMSSVAAPIPKRSRHDTVDSKYDADKSTIGSRTLSQEQKTTLISMGVKVPKENPSILYYSVQIFLVLSIMGEMAAIAFFLFLNERFFEFEIIIGTSHLFLISTPILVFLISIMITLHSLYSIVTLIGSRNSAQSKRVVSFNMTLQIIVVVMLGILASAFLLNRFYLKPEPFRPILLHYIHAAGYSEEALRIINRVQTTFECCGVEARHIVLTDEKRILSNLADPLNAWYYNHNFSNYYFYRGDEIPGSNIIKLFALNGVPASCCNYDIEHCAHSYSQSSIGIAKTENVVPMMNDIMTSIHNVDCANQLVTLMGNNMFMVSMFLGASLVVHIMCILKMGLIKLFLNKTDQTIAMLQTILNTAPVTGAPLNANGKQSYSYLATLPKTTGMSTGRIRSRSMATGKIEPTPKTSRKASSSKPTSKTGTYNSKKKISTQSKTGTFPSRRRK